MEARESPYEKTGFLRRLSPPRWLRRLLSGILAVLVLGAAAWVLWWRLEDLTWAEVAEAVGRIPVSGLVLATLATVGTYAALAGFDMLAVRSLRANVPARRAALTGFIAQSVSHTAGFGSVTGPAIRWRLYHRYGVGPGQIGLIVLFVFWTFTLGALPLGIVALLTQRTRIAAIAGVPEGLLFAAAGLLALLLGGYLWASWRRQPVRLGRWRLTTPGPRTTAWQLVLGLLDILFAAAIFWLLLPDGAMPFTRYMALYMLTIVGGVITHVPGGIGVFEAMMLLFFPDQPAAVILGAALIYRLLYNLIPLALALIAFAWVEVRERLSS